MSNHNNLFDDPFSLFEDALSKAVNLSNALFNEALFNNDKSSVKVYKFPNAIDKNLCGNNNPPSDIYELNGDYHIDFACAGYSEDDIDINYKENYINIHFAAPKSQDYESKKDYICIKRGIKRSEETVPIFVDTRKYNVNKISVTLKDGILSIVVPADKNFVQEYQIGINGKKPKEIAVEDKKENGSEENK